MRSPIPAIRAEAVDALEPLLEEQSRAGPAVQTLAAAGTGEPPDGGFTVLNRAWEAVLGWTREELLANPVHDLIHPDDVEQTLALLLAGNHRPAHLENFTNRYRHRDGSWRWLLWSARCDGDTWYAAGKDVTDRMWLERQALRDPLTRLPNRLLLMDRTRQALARVGRGGGVVALLFVDLDRL